MAKVLITDTILRDAHQSQAATRMRTEDMLPACEILDKIGYYSLECWGGATFDACLRFLNEDPWERLRKLRKALPNTKLQMLFRGQNILGYKHYADDVVEEFVRLSIKNGIDIIRIFDALNDVRNLETAIKATKKYGGICEVAMSYTVSPVHTEDYFVKLAQQIEELGADTICIKDMANLLLPYKAYSSGQAPQGERQDPHPPAHPQHLRHGRHDAAQGHRGRRGHRRYRPLPAGQRHFPAGHRAAGRHPAGHGVRYRPGPQPHVPGGGAFPQGRR